MESPKPAATERELNLIEVADLIPWVDSLLLHLKPLEGFDTFLLSKGVLINEIRSSKSKITANIGSEIFRNIAEHTQLLLDCEEFWKWVEEAITEKYQIPVVKKDKLKEIEADKQKIIEKMQFVWI